jgi:dipeptidyl aminopeptidase/acylaminoacyl peptidase
MRKGPTMSLRTLLPVLVAALILAAPAHAGDIVFTSNRAGVDTELYVVRDDGSGERRLTFNDIFERAPTWSRDGSRVAFAGFRNGNWDIYSVDSAGGDLQRLTTDPARDDHPQYTADGRIVFQRGPFECPCAAWIMDAAGGGEQQLETGPGNALHPEPSPHGQKLVFASDRDGALSLYTMQLNGEARRKITTGSVFGHFNPRWSPSGNEIAFLSDDDNVDNDVFVVHANGTDLRQLTNTPTRIESWLSWSPDGSEVLFTTGPPPNRLRAVSLADGSERPISTWPSAPLTDGFEDGVRDASLWHAIVDPGSTVAEANGRLELSIAADAVPGGPWNQVDAHYGAQCSLPGDFDFQVDYELLQWPAASGVFAGLHAFFAGAGVSRISSAVQDDYTAWSGSTFTGVPTADLAGSMRLVRSGSVLTASVRSPGGDWATLLSAPADPTAAVAGMGLTAIGPQFAHVATAAAYDNFRLNSGELVCPDWWSDSRADWTG